MTKAEAAFVDAGSREELERLFKATVERGLERVEADAARRKAAEQIESRIARLLALGARTLIVMAVVAALALAVVDFTNEAARRWLNEYQVGAGILVGFVMLAATYGVVEYLISQRADAGVRQVCIHASYFSLSAPLHLCWAFLDAMQHEDWRRARRVYKEHRRTLRQEQPFFTAHPVLAERYIRFRYMQSEMGQLLEIHERFASSSSDTDRSVSEASSLRSCAQTFEEHVREAAALHVSDGGYVPPSVVPRKIIEKRWAEATNFGCQRPSVPPQLRPSDLPSGGHVVSPLVAIGSP